MPDCSAGSGPSVAGHETERGISHQSTRQIREICAKPSTPTNQLTPPSPAYIAYNGATGPSGPVRIATPGAAPEDGFTCYAAFVGSNYGGCRWGDYSMGVAMGNRIFMSTEMIPQAYRDEISNWGTYIYSAPAP